MFFRICSVRGEKHAIYNTDSLLTLVLASLAANVNGKHECFGLVDFDPFFHDSDNTYSRPASPRGRRLVMSVLQWGPLTNPILGTVSSATCGVG